MEVFELQEIVDGISPEELAAEFLDWLVNNVDKYIDNHRTKFILNISPKKTGNMPLAERVEDLYLGLDDCDVESSLKGDAEFDWTSLDDATKAAVEVETEKLQILHSLVARAYEALIADKAGLQRLFEGLAYYYEVVGFRNGIPIEKNIAGAVNVGAFHYEAVSVPVEIKGREPVYDDNGDLVEVRETEAVTYMIPPSFVIDLWLEMFEKKIPTSLF